MNENEITRMVEREMALLRSQRIGDVYERIAGTEPGNQLKLALADIACRLVNKRLRIAEEQRQMANAAARTA